MLISQIRMPSGEQVVAVREDADADARIVRTAAGTYDLARRAAAAGRPLREAIAEHGLGETIDLQAAHREKRVLSPITHPDPAHLHLTGTGLTHLGSAATRDRMHKKIAGADDEAALTDSMKMFRMGLEGGKPAAGETGVQPEWFYKGNGATLAAPGAPLVSPDLRRTAARNPKSPASISSAMTARRFASASRSPTSFPTT